MSFREIDRDRGAYEIVFMDGVDRPVRRIEVYMNVIQEPMHAERIERIISELTSDIMLAMKKQSEDGSMVERWGSMWRESRIIQMD